MKNVLVYGSCVSRDLVSINSDKLRCLDYVARQAWISATSKAVESNVNSKLTSPFQNRMLKGDLRSDALDTVISKADEADFILIDIIDDRFGVHPCDGGYITPSAEFHSSGIAKEVSLGRHLPFGSDEHFELWKASAFIVANRLKSLLDKTFILQATFTDHAIDGSKVPEARGRSASDWNSDYERYYLYAKSVGMQVFTLPEEFAISTPHHQWGAAPFHYVDAAYSWWFAKIEEFMAS